MQQQILFCYPFFRIGQWEFTPSCIFVLFFLIAFPIAHLNIWQKSNQKDCFSDFTYVIHLRKIWADIVLRRKTFYYGGTLRYFDAISCAINSDCESIRTFFC